MGRHLDERADGSYAFFIEGDLQFDTRDEAIYHEALVLPALCLAQPALPDEGLRILICGGGDGLALRECLRFPGVTSVDLVDYDPEVVHLGRTRFIEQNRAAFHDPRVRVYIQDAWEFLAQGGLYDAILLDFTVPRRPEDARILTQEWYTRVRQALAPQGILALNGVSPQKTPEAFWCLHKTVESAGLSALPYRVAIPSFWDQGYGVWAFFLAAHRPLKIAHLRKLHCPVPTTHVDLTQLWRGARFPLAERSLARSLPVHTLENSCLLPLYLNPGLSQILDPEAEIPYDLAPLMQAIPLSHPYHTREMIETLASQVIGSVKSLDIPRLLDALLARASRLTDEIVTELQRLKEFLRDKFPTWVAFRQWSFRLFAILVALMTIANAIAPDNAFAKGSFGLGKASMSRGYTAGYRATRSSFGGQRGSGGSFSFGRQSSFGRMGAQSRIRSVGFRRSYGRGQATDIYGNAYAPRTYIYCGSGFGHVHFYGGSGRPRPANLPPPETHQALFVADDDMLVMENGDVIVTLSETAYLLVNAGTVALFHAKQPDPLLPLYPDPTLFQNIRQSLTEQSETAQEEITIREDWLSWVGWTSPLFSTVQADRAEVRSLKDLSQRIESAQKRLGETKATPLAKNLPTGAVELFAGAFLFPDGKYALRHPDGYWQYTDGKRLWREGEEKKAIPAPPALTEALQSVVKKLVKEMEADIQADDGSLRELLGDWRSVHNDLREYQSLATSYGYDYEVDYGTDTMSASQAISRTQQDIGDVQREYTTTIQDRFKTAQELETLQRVGLSNGTYQAPTLPIEIVPSLEFNSFR